MAMNERIYLVHFESHSADADLVGMQTLLKQLSPVWLSANLLLVRTDGSAKWVHNALAAFLEPGGELSVFTVRGPFVHQGKQAIPDLLAHRLVWGERLGDRDGASGVDGSA